MQYLVEGGDVLKAGTLGTGAMVRNVERGGQ
jgi:hypothetical protein